MAALRLRRRPGSPARSARRTAFPTVSRRRRSAPACWCRSARRTLTGVCDRLPTEVADDDPRATAERLRDSVRRARRRAPTCPADVLALAAVDRRVLRVRPRRSDRRRVASHGLAGEPPGRRRHRGRAARGGRGRGASACRSWPGACWKSPPRRRSLPESDAPHAGWRRPRRPGESAAAAGPRAPHAGAPWARLRLQVLEGEAVAYKTERVVELTAQGLDVAGRASTPGLRLGARQRELLAALAAAPGGLSAVALRERGIDVAGLRRLGLRDLVSVRRRPVERDPFAGAWGRTGRPDAAASEVTLTPEQDAALERLRAQPRRPGLPRGPRARRHR